MAGRGSAKVRRSRSVAVVSKMRKRTWQLNYRRTSKESYVSIPKELRGELPEPCSQPFCEQPRDTSVCARRDSTLWRKKTSLTRTAIQPLFRLLWIIPVRGCWRITPSTEMPAKGLVESDTDGCTSRQNFFAICLAIVRFDCLSVEDVRRLGQC